MLRLFVFSSIFALASCHLCMMFPKQRGNMNDLNQAGTADCFHITGPCGGLPQERPIQALKSNEHLNLTLQKNLNHFNASGPGYFAVRWGVPNGNDAYKEMQFDPLFYIEDFASASPFIINAPIQLPNATFPHIVIQAVYVTNNSNAPKEFFQCADVTLF